MATRTLPEPLARPARADTTKVDPKGIIRRWRARRAERKRARLVSARNRRILARWLRRTADRTADPHPFARRREALLGYRAAAVRTELLEIAAAIERTQTPNPACVATLHELLSSGCDSPLYNPRIPMSELHATLDHVRTEL